MLDDVTVVDFSQVRAGPWCTQLLGELGADVIKVERPGVGALERRSEPQQNGFSAGHLARNRYKESVAIDLKTDAGRQLAEDLVADADVVVENFSPGTMEGLGLDYDTLAEVNPEIVYASIKGYGERGPKADAKGVDLVMQAEGGIMSVTGPEDGEPVKLGQALGDIGAGLYATIGILGRLYERDAGEAAAGGGRVGTDLFGTIISFMEEYLTGYGMTGENPTPFGRRHQGRVPYEVAETADGYIAFYTTGGEAGWETFVTEILDAEELLEYDTLESRLANYDEIAEVIHPILRSRTTEEWQAVFDEYDFPNGPLNRVSDVVEHPQAREMGYVVEHEHEEAGPVIVHGHPLHFSGAEAGPVEDAPRLGEHTDSVLRDRLEMDAETIERLRGGGVIE